VTSRSVNGSSRLATSAARRPQCRTSRLLLARTTPCGVQRRRSHPGVHGRRRRQLLAHRGRCTARDPSRAPGGPQRHRLQPRWQSPRRARRRRRPAHRRHRDLGKPRLRPGRPQPLPRRMESLPARRPIHAPMRRLPPQGTESTERRTFTTRRPPAPRYSSPRTGTTSGSQDNPWPSMPTPQANRPQSSSVDRAGSHGAKQRSGHGPRITLFEPARQPHA
jgi:hypothetical protein